MADEPDRTAKLTVVAQVSYRRGDGNPVAMALKYTRLCVADQAYRREVKIGPTWVALDLGWVPVASLVVVENKEGEFKKNPSDEEREEADSRVVEFGVYREGEDPSRATPAVLLRPQEWRGLEFVEGARVAVRCRAGTAACVVSAFPD